MTPRVCTGRDDCTCRPCQTRWRREEVAALRAYGWDTNTIARALGIRPGSLQKLESRQQP